MLNKESKDSIKYAIGHTIVLCVVSVISIYLKSLLDEDMDIN